MSADEPAAGDPLTLDRVGKDAAVRVVAVRALEEDDPYPDMVLRLGIAVGTMLQAEGHDEDQGVRLFRDTSADRRFGLPADACRRVVVEAV